MKKVLLFFTIMISPIMLFGQVAKEQDCLPYEGGCGVI